MSTVSVFTLLQRSDKNMGAVNARVRDYALELVKRAYHQGIYVIITDGFRSYAEQDKLYAQGRTTKGNVVTNAKGGQSIHNFGYAIDYALMDSKGKIHWDINRDLNGNQVKDWFEVGKIGKQMGFQWGGDWTSFKDYPHLDFQKGLTLAQFRAGKRPTIPALKARGYLGIGDDGSEVMEMQKLANTKGAKLEVDGVFGEGTRNWLLVFQKNNKLTPDGLYGKNSRDILSWIQKPKEEVKEAVKKPTVAQKKFAESFDRMVKLKITDGSNPKDYATREEVAVMIDRALQTIK